jgi:spore coat polysaccharide biosynthesis protein SpsF (cytidylyltransferase family)
MTKILSIIQARTGSTRLPGKVLLPLEDKTVLEHVIERTRKSRLINKTIVATSIKKQDLPIVKICAEKNIQVFTGSETNVLDRYYQAARLFLPDNIVRITADCPAIDPVIIDKTIKKCLRENADYASNQLTETYPDGLDLEIFTFKALEQAWKKAKKPSEKEHVTPYIRYNPSLFKIAGIESKENLKNKRWTLDEPRDYEFLKIIFKQVYTKKPDILTEDV